MTRLGGHDVGRRNPIQVIGVCPRTGFTTLCDELVREGANDDHLGADGFVLMAFLVSWATPVGSGKRVWETSAAAISEQFGWGLNRERASRAIARAVKDKRLLVRQYIRDGQLVSRRSSYLVCAGGRRFTESELLDWDKPIPLPSRGDAA